MLESARKHTRTYARAQTKVIHRSLLCACTYAGLGPSLVFPAAGVIGAARCFPSRRLFSVCLPWFCAGSREVAVRRFCAKKRSLCYLLSWDCALSAIYDWETTLPSKFFLFEERRGKERWNCCGSFSARSSQSFWVDGWPLPKLYSERIARAWQVFEFGCKRNVRRSKEGEPWKIMNHEEVYYLVSVSWFLFFVFLF